MRGSPAPVIKKPSPFLMRASNLTRQRPTLPPLEGAVPSALRTLTAVFGMGTGVASSQLLPRILFYYQSHGRQGRPPCTILHFQFVVGSGDSPTQDEFRDILTE